MKTIKNIQNKELNSNMNRMMSQLDAKAASIDNYFIATEQDNIKGNGSFDDTEGIQQLLDVAASNNGVRIVFPAGTYILTQELRLTEGTYLECDPNAKFLKSHNGPMLLNLRPEDKMERYSGNGNITIDGGIWDSNYPAFGGGTSHVFGHGDGIRIMNLTIRNVGGGHGIEFNACRNILVQNCNFNGFDNYGGEKSYSEAIQLDLDKGDGVFPWGGNSGDNTPCQDVYIVNNRFTSSAELGPWGRAVGSHSATADRWHERVVIVNNIVLGCHTWAFRTYSWRDVIISNNKIEQCGGGISVDPNNVDGVDDTDVNGKPTGESNICERFTISGNIIDGGGSYGSAMSISGNNTDSIRSVTVTGNTINNYNGNAIYTGYINEAVFSGNVLNNVEYGIKLVQSWMVNITGNLLRSVANTGIECFSGNKQVNINGNHLNFVRGQGIWVSGTDTIGITNNEITGVGYVANGSDWQGVRVTSKADRVTVVGNTFRQWGKTYKMHYAVYISSSCTNSLLAVNNMAGISNYTSSGTTVYGNLSN